MHSYLLTCCSSGNILVSFHVLANSLQIVTGFFHSFLLLSLQLLSLLCCCSSSSSIIRIVLFQFTLLCCIFYWSFFHQFFMKHCVFESCIKSTAWYWEWMLIVDLGKRKIELSTPFHSLPQWLSQDFFLFIKQQILYCIYCIYTVYANICVLYNSFIGFDLVLRGEWGFNPLLTHKLHCWSVWCSENLLHLVAWWLSLFPGDTFWNYNSNQHKDDLSEAFQYSNVIVSLMILMAVCVCENGGVYMWAYCTCKHRSVCVYLLLTSAESSVSGVCGPSLS